MLRLHMAAIVAAPFFFVSVADVALADDPAPGFALQALPYPGSSIVATLSNGDVIAFDGLDITRHDQSGALIQTYATLSQFAFGSFIEINPSETIALLGESSDQQLYRIDLLTGTVTPLGFATFNFDAVFVDETTAIVSAALCGFCGDNNFVRVDTTTGTIVEFAQVSGYSGPLAIDADGNIYYATQSTTFPPPLGSTSIMRFDAAAIASGNYLFDSDGVAVATGFNGGASMVCDKATGALYLAENSFTTSESFLFDVGSTRATSRLLSTSGTSHAIGGLEFVSGTAPAQFAPYQPELGGTLRYTTTNFFSIFERYQLQPARAELTLAGPGVSAAGPFDVLLAGGPANGVAIIVYGPQSLLAPSEVGYVTGVTAPLFTRLDLLSFAYGPFLSLDVDGEASIDYVNPGSWQGTAALQAVMIDPWLGVVGTSTMALN